MKKNKTNVNVQNLIPKKIFTAIENIGLTKTMKGKAIKLVCLILRNAMYDKRDFAAFQPLPAKYLEKIFNKEYHKDFFNQMKQAGIIECNENYKQGSKAKPGFSKSYRLNQSMLEDEEFIPVCYEEKKDSKTKLKNGNSDNDMIFINKTYQYCEENAKRPSSYTDVPLSSSLSSSLSNSSFSSSSNYYHISPRFFNKMLLFDDLRSLVFNEERILEANKARIEEVRSRLVVDEDIKQFYFEVNNTLVHCEYFVSKDSALSWAREHNANLIKDGRHFYIAHLEKYIENKKRNIRIFNRWQMEKLKNKVFYANRNSVNKRLDHNLTSISKHVINVIKEDNDLVEIDLKNSQFAIHAYWIKKDGLCVHEDVQTYYEMCSQGILYEHLATSLNISRAAAKELMMEIAFSSEKNNTSAKASFRKNFPNVVAHIDGFKKEKKDYRLFSNELQQIEAEIVIDNLYPNIKELGCFCLTRHDSIIIKRQDQHEVIKLIKAYFNHLEFECVLDVGGIKVIIR